MELLAHTGSNRVTVIRANKIPRIYQHTDTFPEPEWMLISDEQRRSRLRHEKRGITRLPYPYSLCPKSFGPTALGFPRSDHVRYSKH